MLRLFTTMLFLCISINVWTQVTTNPTGRFKSLPPIVRSSSTTASDINTISWNIVFETLPNAGHKKLFHVNEIKELKNKAKRNMPSPYPLSESSSKTAASAPSIGINFKGNELKSWTPTDNTIAISNGGKIVSCVNYGIDYYDTISGSFSVSQTWNAFINDSTLNSAKFDPRVIYDKLHDRFIVVLLHGFTSAKSKILVCFSKSNNPIDGWHIYTLSGNPFGNNAWTDFPTIGVNEHELFINGNQFGDAPLYAWKGTYIYQINLQEGYNGDPLLSGIWDGISTPGGLDGITLYPASHGLGDSMYQQMYFAQLMPDSGSMVYLYRIKGLLSDTNKSMTAYEYPIPSYEVCGTAYQRDPNSLIVDSLSTGSAWTQNAFYLNNMVHFAFGADVGGWCGIHYGRIDLDSGKAEVKSFSEAGTDLCYPAVASLGYDSTDRSVGIAYVRSDSVVTILPETGVISVDHQMNFSVLQTVKKGDTSVNILYPPTYAIQPERWGDYTGVCRYFGNGTPQIWMAGAYGANTPPRNNSYGTWIAQILTTESQPVKVQNHVQQKMPVQVYPNPAYDQFTLNFKNEIAGQISITLVDMQGRIIRHLFDDYLQPGMNRISFNQGMLPKGSYLIKINRDGQMMQTEKLILH